MNYKDSFLSNNKTSIVVSSSNQYITMAATTDQSFVLLPVK